MLSFTVADIPKVFSPRDGLAFLSSLDGVMTSYDGAKVFASQAPLVNIMRLLALTNNGTKIAVELSRHAMTLAPKSLNTYWFLRWSCPSRWGIWKLAEAGQMLNQLTADDRRIIVTVSRIIVGKAIRTESSADGKLRHLAVSLAREEQ